MSPGLFETDVRRVTPGLASRRVAVTRIGDTSKRLEAILAFLPDEKTTRQQNSRCGYTVRSADGISSGLFAEHESLKLIAEPYNRRQSQSLLVLMSVCPDLQHNVGIG